MSSRARRQPRVEDDDGEEPSWSDMQFGVGALPPNHGKQ